jgi:hypothetical protein
MTPLLVALLVAGAGLLVIHQTVQQKAAMKQRVEYRFLPLPLDQWFKEQQFSAFATLSDMVNDTNGYCITQPTGTPLPEPTPFPTTAPPVPTTTAPPFTSPPPA